MESYVCGFVMHNEDVVTILKNKPVWQKGKLNGVGGKIEVNETPREAMVREWSEETGETRPDGWELFYEVIFDSCKVFFFRNRVEELNIRDATDEPLFYLDRDFDAYAVADGNYVELKTIPNLKWLIPLALSGEVLTGRQESRLEMDLLNLSNRIA